MEEPTVEVRVDDLRFVLEWLGELLELHGAGESSHGEHFQRLAAAVAEVTV